MDEQGNSSNAFRHPNKKRADGSLPTDRPIVTFTHEQSKQVIRTQKDRIVLGSVVSADVRLVGPGISPIHAVIETAGIPTTLTLYDLGSDSGVLVNGKKAVTQVLKKGDTITLGGQTLNVSVENLTDVPQSVRVQESGGQRLFQSSREDLAPLLLEQEQEVEEVFDYRPSDKQALEVVMSWRDTILDIEHFVSEREVTVGTTAKSDFAIPPLLSAVRYALVTRGPDGQFTLNLDSQMKGVIQKRGMLTSVKDLGTQVVALEKNDFAKVSVGEIDFYVSYTAAPPRLKRQRVLERDPFFRRVLTVSLLFTFMLILGVWNAKVPQQIDIEQVPERIATILYQPEKYTDKVVKKPVQEASHESAPVEKIQPKPVPEKTVKVDIKPNPSHANKPIPKEMDMGTQQSKTGKSAQQKRKTRRAQGQGKEGQGARAKGPTGTRGSKNGASGKEHQQTAKRPSPEGGKGKGGGSSQVRDEGNLDLLKGAGEKIQNLLGNSGEKLGKAGSQLQGFGGFDTQGNGGLALSGTGSGGGGNAASLGGLSDRGRGGGRVGTGMGAAGSGSSLVGGKTRVVLRTGGPEETVVMGSIDSSAIEAALLAHRDEFRLCYEREINAGQPKLAGRVSTSFVIASSGRVNQAGIASSSVKNGNIERCILEVIKRIEFPLPKGGGVVQVTYPFKFSPVGS